MNGWSSRPDNLWGDEPAWVYEISWEWEPLGGQRYPEARTGAILQGWLRELRTGEVRGIAHLVVELLGEDVPEQSARGHADHGEDEGHHADHRRDQACLQAPPATLPGACRPAHCGALIM